ncbi:MAG: HutD family protein [Proteobacteria bacterium]|nr:HutD family protein [Pseudomonadota bacterium]
MSWTIISLADVQPQPWKNGGGTTRELLAWPSAALWQVRLSVAEVAADGPFSRFEGVRRAFAVLSGAGVRLVIDGQAHALTPASEPLAFDGAAGTQCTLLGGVTQDFNLMVRAGVPALRRVRGRAQVGPAVLQAVYAASGPAAVHCGGKVLALPPHTLAWRLDGAALQVQADDALSMEVSL